MALIKNITQDSIFKVDPVGIDEIVQDLQQHLQNKIEWLDLAFGVAYKNEDKDGKLIPEVYWKENEYLTVLPDDTVENSFCFFDIDNKHLFSRAQGMVTTGIGCIFFVNLSKIYPDKAHRTTEEIKRDAFVELSKYARGFEVTEVTIGVKDVYNRYSFEVNQNLTDMQKFFVFSIEMDLKFMYKCEN